MKMIKRDIFKDWLPIILLVAINLVIGVFIVKDYGLSWDEPGNYRYGIHSLANYYNLFHGMPVTDFNELHLDQKGPFFFMAAEGFSRLTTALNPSWSEINGWHYSYFLAFQLSIISLYFITRRWANRWAAFGAALLFSTQPLFWGHAFINPKDIPFMSFFLASIALGLRMVDLLFGPEQFNIDYSAIQWQVFRKDWQQAFIVRKIVTVFIGVLWFGLGLFAWLNRHLINTAIEVLIKNVYNAQGFWGGLFLKFAPHAGSVAVESYIAKAQAVLMRWEIGLFLLAGVVLFFLLLKMISPASFSTLLKGVLLPGGKAAWHYLTRPALILAAIVLGLTISIRLSAPYAGLLVGMYALTRKKRKPLVAFLPYSVLALVAAFLTWPYLWRDPIGRFIDSMHAMADYSVASTENSRFLLLKLISIQFTEPVIILFLTGIVLAILNSKKDKFREPFLLMFFWFFLPVAIAVATQSSLYDNFRQLFFLLPAVFVMVAVALDVLFIKLNRVWLNFVILLFLALPGIYASFQLHPYEYIYFNSLVGGVKGAYRHYELDYWATSYKEAAEYLNEVAPIDARIGVVGTDLILKPYARPDLKINYFNSVDVGKGFDYVVISSRANNDLAICPRAKVVKTIERNGAVLTVIKQTSPSGEECILQP